ncbi:MAG: DUF2723 domain-containing protein [Candidatus Cloacimonadaceae bacterium]|nr:DUF2723 domain-containing protein [Candidatus Cloacimonadaceae bacterium]
MNKQKLDLKKIKELAQMGKIPATTGKEYQKPRPRVPIDDADLRPCELVKPKINWIAAGIVFSLTLIVYMLTQARTLSFWDSGEYATCISILGVPHPPGNPFYILFGRAVVALFGGGFSHAVIAAFISGITSALAVMFTYLMTVQLVSMFRIKAWEAMYAGIVAAFFTAFSFTFWMNAIEAEVYAGLVFFVNLIIWLILYWVQKSRDMNRQNILLLILYLFSLGFCVHQTALQIAPAVLFIVIYPLLRGGTTKSSFWPKVIGYTIALLFGYIIFGRIGKGFGIDDFDKWGFALVAFLLLYIELRDVIDRRVWWIGIGLVLVGLSSHLYLMVRASDRPFINEGHPSTMSMFKDYVLRKQYGETSFFVRRGHFIKDQLGYHFLRYFNMQWFNAEMLSKWLSVPANLINSIGTAIVALLGLFGAIFHQRRNRHSFYYFLSIMIVTTIVMVFVMNLSDGEVRDRDYFFVVAYNMWAVWLGIGALGILYLFKTEMPKYILAGLILILPLINFVSQYHVHDRSKEFIALDYGVNFLNSMEENAIIFTNGDNDTFPIWYAQAVHDPYAKEHVYPAKDVYPYPAALESIKSAMDFKTKNLRGIRKDVSVANLSLLNTPWYIKQLRDKEGILFNWTDEQIDELRPREITQPLTISAGAAAPDMRFRVDYEKSPPWRQNEPVYRISDLAVMQIIKANFGKRPIYFAVTCESYIGFDDYLRNEGMVSRLTHVKTDEDVAVEINRLLNNIDKVYEYRSILDDKVYKDDNMRRLVMNYGSGYVRASTWFIKKREFEKAKHYIDKARKFVTDEIRLIDFHVRYNAGTGNWTALDKFIEDNVFRHSDGWRIYLSYVMSYLMDTYPEKAMSYFRKGMLQYPDQDYMAAFTSHFAKNTGKQAEAIAMFDSIQPLIRYDLSKHKAFLMQRQLPSTNDSDMFE